MKYLIGFIIGVAIAVAGGAYAVDVRVEVKENPCNVAMAEAKKILQLIK